MNNNILPVPSSHAPKYWVSGFLLCCLFISLPSSLLHAQDGNPRHPGVARFELVGSLPNTNPAGGLGIWPLGDVNRDGIADYATERYFDTVAGPGRRAQELVLLHGIKGRLRTIEEGSRLAPSELLSATHFLAVGDWDGQNGPDICVRTILFNDTSFGRPEGRNVFRVVVFWNDGNGQFSLNDTTQLFPGIYASYAPDYGVSADLNKDGVDDLTLLGGRAVKFYKRNCMS